MARLAYNDSNQWGWDGPADPNQEGFVDEEDGKQRRRFVGNSATPQSRFRVKPTLFGEQQNIANFDNNYLNNGLPQLEQKISSFDTNYLGNGTGSPQRPNWMTNSQGGLQTAPGLNTPVMGQEPVDAQLVTKDPTGRPWPMIPPNYQPKDVTELQKRYGWGGL